MPLKLTVSDLTEVPESLRSAYRQRGDGGGFILDVEGGVVAKSVHDEFRAKNIELSKKLTAIGDLTPESIAEMTEKVSKLESDLQAARKGANADIEAKLKATVSERDQFRGQLESVVIDQQVTRVAAEIGAHSGALDDIAARVRSRFKLGDDGQPRAVDAQGNTAYGEDGKPLSVAGAVRMLTRTAPHLFRTISGGGGANGGERFTVSGNPWSKSNWNVTEQMKAFRADPAAAKQMAAEAGQKI